MCNEPLTLDDDAGIHHIAHTLGHLHAFLVQNKAVSKHLVRHMEYVGSLGTCLLGPTLGQGALSRGA